MPVMVKEVPVGVTLNDVGLPPPTRFSQTIGLTNWKPDFWVSVMTIVEDPVNPLGVHWKVTAPLP